jgi:hypothetical protein
MVGAHYGRQRIRNALKAPKGRITVGAYYGRKGIRNALKAPKGRIMVGAHYGRQRIRNALKAPKGRSMVGAYYGRGVLQLSIVQNMQCLFENINSTPIYKKSFLIRKKIETWQEHTHN